MTSLDIVRGKDPRGPAAVLAVTGGRK